MAYFNESEKVPSGCVSWRWLLWGWNRIDWSGYFIFAQKLDDEINVANIQDDERNEALNPMSNILNACNGYSL